RTSDSLSLHDALPIWELLKRMGNQCTTQYDQTIRSFPVLRRRPFGRLASEYTGDATPADRMMKQVHTHLFWCGIGAQRDLSIHRVDDKHIPVIPVTNRRTGTGKTSHVARVTHKNRALALTSNPEGLPVDGVPADGTTGNRGHRGGDIERGHMPEPRTRGSIWVQAGQGKSLGPFGNIGPAQLGQFVFATEFFYDRSVRQPAAVGEVLTRQGHVVQFWSPLIWIQARGCIIARSMHDVYSSVTITPRDSLEPASDPRLAQ